MSASSPWSPAASRRWLRGLILPILLIIILSGIYVYEARFDNQNADGDQAWVGHWMAVAGVACAIWVVLYGCVFAIASRFVRPADRSHDVAATSAVDATSQRLAVLDQLRTSGRISEQEWAEQRRAVLSGL
ncbi:MAG: hypothetical protein M3Y49_03590 [Actinomycetota bacterium]|nr:hypothetical protein [Actinomycetota bacterium]